jgi:hypothetical protein
MSTTPAPTTDYKERLYMYRGSLYFTVVICPGCKLNSRLLWPTRLTKYPSGTFKFECPRCLRISSREDLDVHSICHIGGGCEGMPTAAVVMV